MRTLNKLIQERIHDSYKLRRKPAGPALCRDCGAVYRAGRWRWEAAPAGAAQARCPACQRVRDRLPGATVTLGGDFLAAHRDEILGTIRNCEQAEKAARPMQRIMSMTTRNGQLHIATTDARLARRIGDALHRSFKGELDYRYHKGESQLRVTWRR